MRRVKIDPSLKRKVLAKFQFPLGVYPVEDMTPKPGYASAFEQADGGGQDSDLEEWPDRYAFDIVISAERLPALCRSLFAIFEGRVYPILDILGHDAYREIDPYIAYDLVGMDQFYEGIRRFGDYLYEDGMCGFGVMSESPFCYLFVDEHKIVTIRAEPPLRERVERALRAFDLEVTDSAAGADASAHEHRSVILAPIDNMELLAPEDILEQLKIHWNLLLNVDPDANHDDEGKPLGTTHWRSLVRLEDEGHIRYAEVLFDADNLREAEDVTFSAVHDLADQEEQSWDDTLIVTMDRLTKESLTQLLANTETKTAPRKKTRAESTRKKGATPHKSPDQSPASGRVYLVRWLGQPLPA